MKCPRDNTILSPHQKGKVDIHFCQECHGFFLSLGQKSAERLESLLRKRFANAQNNVGEDPVISPQSGLAMKRFEYRNVFLDYCVESHSVWFDRGEYTKIFASDSQTSESKKSASQSDSITWDVITTSFDILDVSGNLIGAVGGLVGDLISGIDL